jgi:hypothetical protein
VGEKALVLKEALEQAYLASEEDLQVQVASGKGAP